MTLNERIMKTIFAFLLLMSSTAIVHAQESENDELYSTTSSYSTLYKDFTDAVVYMKDGKELTTKANIFMVNSSLYYMHGPMTMQANMKTIDRVEFREKKQKFFVLDTLMAFVVDTVKGNELIAVKFIDVKAFVAQKKSSTILSNVVGMKLGDFVTSSHIDSKENPEFPVYFKYFYRLHGKIVPINDRDTYRLIPKDKQRVFKTVTQLPEFDWYDRTWLLKLLKYIS